MIVITLKDIFQLALIAVACIPFVCILLALLFAKFDKIKDKLFGKKTKRRNKGNGTQTKGA